jgi:protein-disulfide isomerase
MRQLSDVNQVVPPLSDRDHIQGSLTAALILMEYGDFQCPRSQQAYFTIKEVLQQLDHQFCFVFRHFPQPQRHPQSQRAAESAEAAAAQNKFWEMHDLLFENQHAIDDGDLVQYAAQLGLDIPQFLRDLAEHLHRTRVHQDIESGRDNGVEATPTFFIGVRCEGTQNLERVLMSLVKRI